jgi:SAM-dependent methyltransferase
MNQVANPEDSCRGPEDQYHLGELRIALNPKHPAHNLPEIRRGETVLDIGCGAGQTLIAACPYRAKGSVGLCDCEANGCPGNWGCGIDPDEGALRLGRTWTRLELKHGFGEAIPYPDQSFDLVVSRVALAYSDIPAAVAEIRRVLKPGGRIWVTLHPLSLVREQAAKANLRGKIFNTYVVLNGLAFHLFLRTFRLGRFSESWQSESAMRRLLQKSGFHDVAGKRTEHYSLVTARG